jgi:hypothetical protein
VFSPQYAYTRCIGLPHTSKGDRVPARKGFAERLDAPERVNPPNRAVAATERRAIKKLMRRGSRTDAPDSLPIGDIKEASSLFQPRDDSIAFAPGRSEGHVSSLTKALKAGGLLDPLTVIALGDDWYLIDGHHRLAAYRGQQWSAPIPVNVQRSDLTGDQRIEWAIGLSYADNKKDHLNISSVDKADGAWRAVMNDTGLSKAETAERYGVAPSTVAAMRRAKTALEAEGAHMPTLTKWRSAGLELRRLQDPNSDRGTGDWEEEHQRQLAKRLQPVMAMHPSPGQLYAALEAFEPGMVEAMTIAGQREDDEGGGLDI